MFRVLHYSDLEAAYDDPDRVGRLAGLLAARRDEATLVVGTGDTTAPGVLSLVTEGEQALDLFSAIEPDAATFGNHDFDYGLDRTKELVAASPQAWVSTNVYLDGERFGTDVGVVPTKTITVGDSTVGLFGVLDDATPALNPMAEPLTVTDPYEAGAKAAADLRDRGAEYVLALSHLGQGDERLALEADVDAVLGGHVHSERIERVADTVLTRPGVNGHVVLELVVDDGLDVTRHEVDDAPKDERVATQLQNRRESAGLDTPVGTVTDPIERSERTVFRGESRIGNFVADAYRWAAATDVGLQNSGGIREGPALAGTVTVADLISVVPFEEPVVIAAVDGAELETLFRQARGQAFGFGEPDWWHAHVSGVRVTLDGDAVDRVTVAGDPIDHEATYTVATTDYLLYSDTEFPVLTPAHRVEELETQHRVLVDYAEAVGIDPEIDGRIVSDGGDPMTALRRPHPSDDPNAGEGARR